LILFHFVSILSFNIANTSFINVIIA